MIKRNLPWVGLIGVVALLLSNFSLAFLSEPAGVEASSHREAPLISQDPVADATDNYAFVSPDRPDTVTLISNWIPFETPHGGPNFFRFGDDVLYEYHIDNVGDAQDHISFQFRFKTVVINDKTFLRTTGPLAMPSDLQYNVRQYMTVTRLDAPADGSCKNQPLANCATAKSTVLGKDIVVAPDNVGPNSIPFYPAAAAMSVGELSGGGRIFAGPRADPFFVDVGAIFDLLQVKSHGINSTAGFNVHTIAMQLPINQVTKDGSRPTDPNSGSAVIGTWTTSSRQANKVFSAGSTSSNGAWVQIQRLGMPLVNEVVVPLALKDAFNSLYPWQDATIPAVVAVVVDPEPARLLNAIYGIAVPPTPRNDILMVFAQGVKGLNQPPNVVPSEQLRLNLAIPPVAGTPANRMGVLQGDLGGFPNGRRLTDDVTDIELQVVIGVLQCKPTDTPETCTFAAKDKNGKATVYSSLGDGVNEPAGKLMGSFPYMAQPWNGYYYFPEGAVPANKDLTGNGRD